MRYGLITLASVGWMAVAGTLPGQAQTYMVPGEVIVPVEAVRDIAYDYGIVSIDGVDFNRHTGRWEVEGTDAFDNDIDMEVDANTGAVLSIER